MEYDWLINIDEWELTTEEQFESMKHMYKGLLLIMTIIVIKKDSKGQPEHAKYRIIVLSNLDQNKWTKQEFLHL